MIEYKISQSEKDEIDKILQDISNGTARINQILSNARIIQNGQSVAAAPKPETAVVKERLTTNIIESLFGPYQNLRVYNNEEERLIARHYNAIEPCWTEEHTRQSRFLKQQFEEKFPQFELVAQVTMQVPECNFPGGEHKWIGEHMVVNFSAAGISTVGNLIIRDKQTGKLERFNKNRWFGVNRHIDSNCAAKHGACSLPLFVADIPNFLKNLLAGRNVR